jgi:hypothetical protein
MTPTDYRRLRRLLQRERQKGVVAFDQLTDLALRATDDVDAHVDPVPGPEGVRRDRLGADRDARHWGGRFPGGPVR